jgi:hypothetical protein
LRLLFVCAILFVSVSVCLCLWLCMCVTDARARGRSKQLLEKIPDDVIFDPTLPRDPKLRCGVCHEQGVVLLRARGGGPDDALKLIVVCINVECRHRWIPGEEEVVEMEES